MLVFHITLKSRTFLSQNVSPSIAITLFSVTISRDPRAMKYRAVRMSPGWISVSPGGACVVLNCSDSARRQPAMDAKKVFTLCAKVFFVRSEKLNVHESV